MSTKIYYGLKSSKLCLDIYTELQEFRQKHIYDNPKIQFIDPLKYYTTENYDRREKLLKDGHVFESSVILFPTNEYTLAFPVFCDYLLVALGLNYEKMYKYFIKHTSFESYYYFDNTDRPDHITEDEWEERYEAWKVIGYGPIKQYGLIFELCQETDYIKR